eukprot:640947-Hanusia_phi.AAC.1
MRRAADMRQEPAPAACPAQLKMISEADRKESKTMKGARQEKGGGRSEQQRRSSRNARMRMRKEEEEEEEEDRWLAG